MAKKGASLQKQLAAGIKPILIITGSLSFIIFMSAIGFEGGNRYEIRRGPEIAKSIADILGTSLTSLGFFSFITFAMSLGLVIFIRLKFSPKDKEIENLFGTLPKKDPTKPKQGQTSQNPALSPFFKFIIWILVILFVCLAVLAIWTEV